MCTLCNDLWQTLSGDQMGRQIITTGPTELLHEQLANHLTSVRPSVIGIASAFVSNGGVTTLTRLLNTAATTECRLLAGTDHYITHPRALAVAQEKGWNVRLAESPVGPGIFHPKLIVGGSRFEADGSVGDLSFTYVGSANLTLRNVEKR